MQILPHEKQILNISEKVSRKKTNLDIKILFDAYHNYRKKLIQLSDNNEFKLVTQKVNLLNEYAQIVYAQDYWKHLCGNISKIYSSLFEEFFFELLKDMPELNRFPTMVLGKAKTYLQLSLAPGNIEDFFNHPCVHIKSKQQDFTISKIIQCSFNNKNSTEILKKDIVVPTVVIECKRYVAVTMLDQIAYEAQRLKEGNPFALFIVAAEQSALSKAINLGEYRFIDEIFILRKQKRTNSPENQNPVDFDVVWQLYDLIKKYLSSNWADVEKRLKTGKLIHP